jgi:hypothetical protein
MLDELFAGLPGLEGPATIPTASFDAAKAFFLAAVAEELTQPKPEPAAKPAAAGKKGAAPAKRATSAAKNRPGSKKKK